MMFMIDFPEHLGDCPFISYCSRIFFSEISSLARYIFSPLLLGTCKCTKLHILSNQIAWLYHISQGCYPLPSIAALLSKSLWKIFLFLSLSISCLLSNDSFSNIQRGYLERKKKRPAKRKPPHITPGFKYNILFILESLVEKILK